MRQIQYYSVDYVGLTFQPDIPSISSVPENLVLTFDELVVHRPWFTSITFPPCARETAASNGPLRKRQS